MQVSSIFQQKKRCTTVSCAVIELAQMLLVAVVMIRLVAYIASPEQPIPPPAPYSAKPLAVQVDSFSVVQVIDLSAHSINLLQSKFRFEPDYIEPWVDPNQIEYDECEYMYDWQTRVHPTCNTMHELGFAANPLNLSFVDVGMVRDVWDTTDSTGSRWALKTLRSINRYDDFYYNAQAKDAVISEQLTFSKYVANIHGFCGVSSLYEFASEGTLEAHYEHLTTKERLVTAAHISEAVADLHTLGDDPKYGSYAPIAHADIAERQFIKLHGEFKLTDFNLAFLMKWNTTNDKRTCKIRKIQFITNNRSPEEIKDEWCWIDEKVDVYSMGNVYFQLLTNTRKYDNLHLNEAVRLILAGGTPKIPDYLSNSTDIAIVALREAMTMSLVLEPERRPTTKQVADYLQRKLQLYKKQERLAQMDRNNCVAIEANPFAEECDSRV